MSEKLTFLMKGWTDRGDDGSPLHHVLVEIDAAAAEALWQRMQMVMRVRAEDQDFYEMSWSDHSPIWRTQPEDWWEFEDEPEHPFHAFQQALDEAVYSKGAGVFFDGLVPPAKQVALEAPKMRVQKDCLYWKAYYSNGQGVDTSSLERADLLVARVWFAPENERAEKFADLVRHAPYRAAEVLAHGLDVGVGFARTPLRCSISRDVLLPLLEHQHAKIRQNAILALGNMNVAPRQQGRSR